METKYVMRFVLIKMKKKTNESFDLICGLKKSPNALKIMFTQNLKKNPLMKTKIHHSHVIEFNCYVRFI